MTKPKLPLKSEPDSGWLAGRAPGDCPACGAHLLIVEFGKYSHHEGAMADYEQLECPNCKFVRYAYYPVSSHTVGQPDDIPF